jgi:ATP-dependent protease ClpP protease subunit
MNPFVRNPQAYRRTPIRAERPEPKTDSGVATLRLYDPLDSWGEYWGVSAKEFVGALDELGDDVTEIRLLINSPGGEVWEGLAILNALRAHPARVVAVVEGIAASAASFVAAGADELVIMQNAELFIHNAWGMAVGNAADMAKMSSELAHEDRNIASIYAAKSGGTVDEWLAAMAAETWYSADEAVEAGLADRVEAPKSDGASEAKNRFDLSRFRNSARPVAPAARIPSPVRAEADRKRGTRMSLNTDIAERLGLAEDASDEEILAALDELTTSTEGDEKPENRAELPEGVVAVDASALAELQARAARGDEARTRQERDERIAAVKAAVREGRIAPADRDKWLNRVNEDPRELEVLNRLTPVYPVGNEIGHAQVPADSVNDADLGWFDSVPGAASK